MTKTCSHCSAPNTADSRFCQLCGKPFADGTRTQSDTPAEQSTVRWQGKPIQMLAQMRRSTSLEQLFAKKTRVLIGRAPECDVCLPHPMVSRYHAELQRTPDGQLRIADRGSMNGITVGGRRLMGAAVLHDREQVGIGPFLFSIAGQTLVTIDNSRGLRLEAQALQKVVTLASGEKRALLDDINLVIEPGEFVCVLGPSGSGKSTLMDCLNGRRRATGGRVLANGEDFYRHFDSFRQSLGYVPQRDIVHTQLTVARALYYTAQLRLPTDTGGAELFARMEEVIHQMELSPHRQTMVANLSGGQIKRVSLGAELLARPSMLYIDEATSGLDAGIEARMMRLFRSLADEGKSLVCITHNVDNVERCHLIIVLARGKLVYYGPPAEATTYFGVKRFSEIYDCLATKDPKDWERDYAASSLHQEFVAKRLTAAAATPAPHSEAGATKPAVDSGSWRSRSSSAIVTPSDITPRRRPQYTPWWHQFRVLTLRYAELLWNDRRSLKLLFLQAPVVGLFVLAGFIGKPFNQKLPILHINDDEYVALQMIRALEKEYEEEGQTTEEGQEPAQGRVVFHITRREAGGRTVSVPMRDVMHRLKEMKKDPAMLDYLETTEITMDLRGENGEITSETRTAGDLLRMQERMNQSNITEQLLEAHDLAQTTSPRYTYAVVFLVSIIVLWFGCNNAAKEIVKEEAVYGRERAVNLGISPYLASKFLLLSFITIVQALVLMLVVYGSLHLLHVVNPSFIQHNEVPSTQYMLPYVLQFLFLCLLSMAGVALGLLLSACVATPDRANALLPYVLIPQIILGGGIMPIRRGLLEWLSWIFSPEYWGFRAIRLGETTLPTIMADNRMDYNDVLWLPFVALVLEIVALLGLTAWFLRRKDAIKA